jgi:glycosyltransferase involved in cell wall biosynthesis
MRMAVAKLVVPALRQRARRRLDRLRPGAATVVTVSWNSRPYLEVFLRTVPRRSPGDLQVLVVDNGSRDGSRQLLARSPQVRSLKLPVNVGHELALDLAFLLVETEYVVSLDVDAFPIHDDWLGQTLAPISKGSTISGARLNRRYVHPCFLAMRTERFVQRGHSFQSAYRGRTATHDASGDAGEIMSAREGGGLHFFEATEQHGPGCLGTVFGHLIYHNFYSTRFETTSAPILDKVVARDDPERVWREAVARFRAG